ncbi:MAG: SpoIIE family protein phosphatase, partial [Candidatus Kapabacteria bacterium]|nr:SpoIIE family protein phosphatase [Candidatus Kapabacteria bacterium]
VVVMYTDGVSEAMNVFDVEYGEERLKRVILDSRTLSVEGIVQALVDDVKSHAGTAPQSDDITILVVRAL